MTPVEDIQAIRKSLGFGEGDAAVLREAAALLAPEVQGWVDAFYARLVGDPVAMALLHDEGEVMRLKRSLLAWFLELFSLPYDAAYESTRAGIGRTHVRIGMPQHLMVTAMSGIRRDVDDAVARVFGGDPARARRVRRATGLALDMELALMLAAYRRRSDELRRRTDRALYAQRIAHRLLRLTQDDADAAMCYAELARGAEDPASRRRWLGALEDAVRGTAGAARRSGVEIRGGASAGRTEPDLAEACARALAGVSLPDRTRVEVSVEPRGLRAALFEEPLRLALEELLQNAANHDPGGTIRVALSRREGGVVEVVVTDSGPGWPAGVRDVGDVYAVGGGMGLAYAEYVADLHGGTIDLFQPPGGGAGVRLILVETSGGETKAHADLAPNP